MIGAAKMFHALGADWTISSAVLEAANFGLLFHLRRRCGEHQQRLKEAAAALGASWSCRASAATAGGRPGCTWTAPAARSPSAWCTCWIMRPQNLDRLPLAQAAPAGRACTIRATTSVAGEIVEQPRQILRACVEELVEMTPNRARELLLRRRLGHPHGRNDGDPPEIGPEKGRTGPAARAAGLPGRALLDLQGPIAARDETLWHGELAMGGIMDLLGKAIQTSDLHRSRNPGEGSFA